MDGFGGAPVWHASISVGSMSAPKTGGKVPWSKLGLKMRAAVRDRVIGLLSSVGDGDTRRDRSEFVLHARRRLNTRELAMLRPEWCAIPATGIAGGGTPW